MTSFAESVSPFGTHATCIHIDKFGNLIPDEDLRGLAFDPNNPSTVYLSGKEVYVSKSTNSTL